MRLTAKKDTNNNGTRDDPGPSHTMPTMPSKKPAYNRVVLHEYPSRDSDSTAPNADRDGPDTDNSAEAACVMTEIDRTIVTMRALPPAMTSPIGCSTAIAPTTSRHGPSGTPIRGREANTGTVEEEIRDGQTSKRRSKHVNEETRNKGKFENEIEPHRSERIKTENCYVVMKCS